MVNDLVRNASIVLQDIEILGADGLGDLLRDGLAYILVSYVPVRQSNSGSLRDLVRLSPRSPKQSNQIQSETKDMTLLYTLFIFLGSLVDLPGPQLGGHRGYQSALHRGT